MNRKEITKLLTAATWSRLRTRGAVFTEVPVSFGQIDILCITKEGEFQGFEIKSCRADWLRDKEQWAHYTTLGHLDRFEYVTVDGELVVKDFEAQLGDSPWRVKHQKVADTIGITTYTELQLGSIKRKVLYEPRLHMRSMPRAKLVRRAKRIPYSSFTCFPSGWKSSRRDIEKRLLIRGMYALRELQEKEPWLQGKYWDDG